MALRVLRLHCSTDVGPRSAVRYGDRRSRHSPFEGREQPKGQPRYGVLVLQPLKGEQPRSFPHANRLAA